MLLIKVEDTEDYNESTGEFIYGKGGTFKIEHSLISLSKWESKWNRSFLMDGPATDEETIDYVKCMTITQNVRPDLYTHMSAENWQEINKYIESDMTAMKMSKNKKKPGVRETITSESLYYAISAYNIPIEAQKWHLNRLIALIEMHNRKNRPKEKMSKQEQARSWREINNKNKKRLNSEG